MALLLAHLLGDFPFQSEWITQNKGKRYWPLMVHGVTHYILAWICLLSFAQISYRSVHGQVVVIGYLFLHLVVDKAKYQLITRDALPDNGMTFLFDQTLHVVFLAIAAAILTRSHISDVAQSIQLSPPTKTRILEAAIIYVAVLFGGGYLIRFLTKGLSKDITPDASTKLDNAGLYVGWIERFLVITAIAIQSPALVGLILTGKSIARFPEFKEVRFAEYFLIGTFLSISLSVLGGIVLLQLFYGTVSLK
jgi:hypothetical protein